MEQTVEVMVEGGKATAAPPLGPALGPLKVNIVQVVGEINKMTKDLDGIRLPVKVIVDTATKKFRIEVGKPPTAALILKELKQEKGSSLAGKGRIGDLTEEQVRRIAKAKFGSDEEPFVNQIKGTARSMGVTIGKGKLSEEEVIEVKKMMAEAKKKEEAKPAEAAAAAPAPDVRK